jgi:hypothetical protein
MSFEDALTPMLRNGSSLSRKLVKSSSGIPTWRSCSTSCRRVCSKYKEKVMFLSDAIREGAKAVPEVHGPLFRCDSNGEVCGACALGAAFYAAAGIRKRGDFRRDLELKTMFPYIVNRVKLPPGLEHMVFNMEALNLDNAIIVLFEVAYWSRERIADWVEELEVQWGVRPSVVKVEEEKEFTFA